VKKVDGRCTQTLTSMAPKGRIWCARPRQEVTSAACATNKMLMFGRGISGKALFYAASINGCMKQKATKEALVAVGLCQVSSAAVCCSVELCF